MALSCSNNNDNDTPNIDDTFLTAKVDGVDFEVRGSLFAVTTNISGITSTSMGATYDDESKTITMGITNLNNTGTGTYPLFDASIHDAQTSPYTSTLIYGEGDIGWYATFFQGNVSGTITITALDTNYVFGTFHFIGFDIDSQTEKNITEGAFKFKRLQTN